MANRQTQPQIGPWLVGGRDTYGKGIDANAAEQVVDDLHLQLVPERFHHIATYSTVFPVAGPGREDHGRHTVNAIMLIDLTPEEVASLNDEVEAHRLSDEYNDGAWYDPTEIAKPESDFPFAMKQMVRDLHDYDRGVVARYDEAQIEDKVVDEMRKKERLETIEKEGIANLCLAFDLTHEEAQQLEHIGRDNTPLALMWAQRSSEQIHGGQGALAEELKNLLNNPELGDFQIQQRLQELSLSKPPIASDNGPALRAFLRTASSALQLDHQQKGELFNKVKLFSAMTG